MASFPELAPLLEKYKKYLCQVKKYSPHSISSYLSDLHTYLQFHQHHIGDWRERDYLTQFLKYLFQNNYANSSICRYRCSLANFFDYLVQYKVLPFSPVKQLGRYKRKQVLPKVWSQNKLKEISNQMRRPVEVAPGKRYCEHRDLLITEMLYGLGLRIGELTQLRVQDIDLSPGMVIVKGKGGHHHLLPLTPRLQKVLGEHLQLRKGFLSIMNKPDHGKLLCNHLGKEITVRGVRYAFQNRILAKGIERIHPHALRHSLAGHLLENGAGIRQVQKVLRHRSLTTTQVYTQISSPFLKSEYQKNHPLARKGTIDKKNNNN